jgi:hypothetical protein
MTTPPNPFAPGPAPDTGDAIDFDARPDQDPDDRIPLFKLDGHWYTIPANPPAGGVLRFLWAVRSGANAEAAAADLVESMVGKEAYAAMATSDKVSIADFGKIMDIVKAKTLGPAMEALGK